MARKTAMKKEPSVSIAIPKSEKERLNKMPGKPQMSDGVTQGKPPAPKRLSPGVYRSSTGELVGSKGQALPNARQARPRGPGDGRDRANAGMLADAMNRSPQVGQVATRPPAPLGTPPEGGQMDQQMGDQWARRDPGFQMQGGGRFGGMVNQPITTPQMTEEQYQQLVEWMKLQGGGGMMPPQGMPGLPQPSANNGGQYRLSPGVYGTREQAMDQYARQFEQAQPMGPALLNRRFGY